jgi:DNA polymerase III sliding clamp (beta) subunit (PCNA family)
VAALGADRLRVLAGDDAVNLYAWGEKGEVSDSVSATVEGDSSTVVSTRYLLDALRAMDGDEVLIEFPDEGERKPLRLSAGRNVQALVMRIAEPETL